LTKEEVIANAVLFLLAGFRTTADSLLYLYYELAHHPDIQQQVLLYSALAAIYVIPDGCICYELKLTFTGIRWQHLCILWRKFL